MTAAEFVRSAEAAAGPLAAARRAGRRAHPCAPSRRRSAAVGTNTNLGIILLCAPLAAAAERQAPDLRDRLAQVLDALDVQDAELAFRAIAARRPGRARARAAHDVFEPATVTLKAGHGGGSDARSHRPPIRLRFRRCIRPGRARVGSGSVALGRPGLGDARGLSRIPVGLPGQPHRAQARRRRPRRRYVAPPCRSMQRMRRGEDRAALRADLLAWDAALKAARHQSGNQRRSHGRHPVRAPIEEHLAVGVATVIDFAARTKSAAIWLTGPALAPDADNKDSRCAERARLRRAARL